MKIDAFCHIMPRPYYDRFFTLDETVHAANLRKRVANIPCLVDMDVRFAQMDEFGDYRQLINICAPPVEDLGSPEISREMARIGNEALAELVRSHPDRFAGFCACVPMDDPDAAVAELEYATRELGALGAQIYTHVHGEAMDAAAVRPVLRGGGPVAAAWCRSTRAAARRGPTTPPRSGPATRSGGRSAGSTTCRPSWPGSCSPGCWSATRTSSC